MHSAAIVAIVGIVSIVLIAIVAMVLRHRERMEKIRFGHSDKEPIKRDGSVLDMRENESRYN